MPYFLPPKKPQQTSCPCVSFYPEVKFASLSPSSGGLRDPEPAPCTSPSAWCSAARWPELFLVSTQREKQVNTAGEETSDASKRYDEETNGTKKKVYCIL